MAVTTADPADLSPLPALVNGDASLVRRGQFMTAVFLLEIGDAPWLVDVREGRVVSVERGPFLMRSWAFAVRVTAEAWQRFCEPVPAPGYQDLLAMTRFGHARVEGDLQPFMANLRYVKDVLEAPRRRRAAVP